MSEENERRFKEWQDDVDATHTDEGIDQELIELMDSPYVDAMMGWSQSMDMGQLTFMLALITSELIGRVGVDKANAVFDNMRNDEGIQAIGALVHAGRIIEMGGTPAEFEVDDEVLTSEAILDDNQETA